MSFVTLIGIWTAATLLGIGAIAATQPLWDRRRPVGALRAPARAGSRPAAECCGNA